MLEDGAAPLAQALPHHVPTLGLVPREPTSPVHFPRCWKVPQPVITALLQRDRPLQGSDKVVPRSELMLTDPLQQLQPSCSCHWSCSVNKAESVTLKE